MLHLKFNSVWLQNGPAIHMRMWPQMGLKTDLQFICWLCISTLNDFEVLSDGPASQLWLTLKVDQQFICSRELWWISQRSCIAYAGPAISARIDFKVTSDGPAIQLWLISKNPLGGIGLPTVSVWAFGGGVGAFQKWHVLVLGFWFWEMHWHLYFGFERSVGTWAVRIWDLHLTFGFDTWLLDFQVGFHFGAPGGVGWVLRTFDAFWIWYLTFGFDTWFLDLILALEIDGFAFEFQISQGCDCIQIEAPMARCASRILYQLAWRLINQH